MEEAEILNCPQRTNSESNVIDVAASISVTWHETRSNQKKKGCVKKRLKKKGDAKEGGRRSSGVLAIIEKDSNAEKLR